MKRILSRVLHSLLGLVLLSLLVLLGAGLLTRLPGEETVAGERRNQARYVTMQDGVKIAVDTWLPPNFEAGKRYPAVLNMTRYWRAHEVGFVQRALVGLGLAEVDQPGQAAGWFNEAGYVWVRVDARGSGASFGNRPVEWPPEEVRDYGEIIDWIAAQAWSNGRVGTYGVSYEGNTALLATVPHRPALKVAAPLYGDFNPLLGLIQPGGARNIYADMWGRAVGMMDRNDICGVAGVRGPKCWLTRLLVPGVKPVDGPEGGALLAQAAAQHRANADVGKETARIRYLDDPYGRTSLTMASVAPFGLKERIEASGVPLIIHAGWTDAATVDGVLSQFMTFSNPQQVLLGAFTHGGRHDTDPFKPVDAPVIPSSREQFDLIRKEFDAYLKRQGTPAPGKRLTYYTMGSGEWRTTDVWPPAGMSMRRWYFAADHSLSSDPPAMDEATDRYLVDRTATNGTTTRWHTNFGGGDVVYGTRAEQDRKLLIYSSAPLAEPMLITGNVEIHLQVAVDRDDALFIAYLEDIAPDGTVRYLTEGELTADNRAISATGLPYRTLGPRHSFLRADALPLVENQITSIAFSLMATSVRIEAGHRLRIALAGADRDMFVPRPADGDVSWQVHRSSAYPSYIDVPVQ